VLLVEDDDDELGSPLDAVFLALAFNLIRGRLPIGLLWRWEDVWEENKGEENEVLEGLVSGEKENRSDEDEEEEEDEKEKNGVSENEEGKEKDELVPEVKKSEEEEEKGSEVREGWEEKTVGVVEEKERKVEEERESEEDEENDGECEEEEEEESRALCNVSLVKPKVLKLSKSFLTP